MMIINRITAALICITMMTPFLAGCGGQSSGASPSGGASTRTAEHHEWFVFVAEGLSDGLLTDVKGETQSLISQVTKTGDVLHVIAAPDHRPVATLVIPDGDPRTRLRHQATRQSLQRIGNYLNANHSNANSQIQLPAVSATVLSLRRTEFPIRIILIGDPVFEDARQRGWSMADGFVPTDGSLESPICPFGSGVATFPEDTEITWLTPESTWGVDHLHQSAVTRFYQLFLRENGGYLARVTADPMSAFSLDGTRLVDEFEADTTGLARMQLVTLASSRTEVEPVSNTIGYEVARHRVDGVTNRREPVIDESVELASDDVDVTEEVPAEPETTPEPEPTPPVRDVPQDVGAILQAAQQSREKITLAINWVSDDSECDIDMRITDTRVRQELNFSTTQTPFGRLLRDVQASGSIEGSLNARWEVAEVNHNQLGEIDLWVNAYRTNRPATVRLIVIWKTERRETTFRMTTPTGDGGRGPRRGSAAWREVDLVGMFGPGTTRRPRRTTR